MADTYHFNKETGVHSLKFDLEMEANQARGAFSYIFDDGWGRLHIYAVRTGDTFVFSIKLDKDDEKDYSVFKGCSVRIRDGQWLSYNTIKIWHNAVDTQYREYSLSGSIRALCFLVININYVSYLHT
jgi:hypothetical protein